jgi:zinc transporter 7
MIAFATGGLLGDVFLHLVPHAFFGEHSDDHGALDGPGHLHVHGSGNSIVVEPKRNIVIGGAIFVGFAAFFVLDKTMRVLSAAAGDGDAHGHGHSHGHNHSHNHAYAGAAASSASSTAIESKADSSELKSRKSPADVTAITPTAPASAITDKASVNPSLKLSAYLNLFGDFTHNITDGLAMAASFYSSPALGAVTTIATFCHEIPHEVSYPLPRGRCSYR